MTWGGAQIVGSDWSVYTGTSAALFGNLDSDGWRLRVTGGYGRYRYDGSGKRFHGQHGFGDVLLGYKAQFGDLTLKGFAGVASAGHTVNPFDPDNDAVGFSYGGIGAIEGWFNYSDQLWLSADSSYSTVFDQFDATLRVGYVALPGTSLGIEAGALGNSDYSAARLATFARYAWSRGDARLSLGASADRDEDVEPYAAISVSLKY